MVKTKYHVFSARTIEEGLKSLNALKEERKIGWDELVIDAVCGHYGMDKEMMSLPKKEKAAKAAGVSQRPTEEVAVEGGLTKAADEKPVKKQRKGTGGKAK